METQDLEELRTIIRHSGVASKKGWWENYLKHEIEFWGTPTAEIRSIIRDWIRTLQPSTRELRDDVWQLLRGPIAEEKLAPLAAAMGAAAD